LDARLVVLLAGAALCGLLAIRSTRLLAAAIWLAGVSALVSVVLYLIGAPQVAVIELSVGAGLVTVLFVFAISIAGEDAMDVRGIVPRPVGLILAVGAVVLLGVMALPALGVTPAAAEGTFADMLWQERGLDVLVQIVVIFAGVIGVLGLLGEATPGAAQIPAARELPEAEDSDSPALKEISA
jgi:uncharacterized MnhB-related membrane protein